MASRPVFIKSMYGAPTNYIEHQTVNNFNITYNYQYNASTTPFSCNDMELLGEYYEEEKVAFISDSETNPPSNINTNVNNNNNNNGDIPPNTESGRIEFADRVKLKFEEMMKMKKYWSHPKWASITTVAVNAYQSKDYNSEYAAWILLTNLEEETQEKHQQQQPQTTNNSEMENVLLDPERKLKVSEVDNIETFVSKINNLMLSNKLKTKELFRVLNEDLFALFIEKWNNSNDYVGRFVEFQSYFAKLIQWDGNKLSSQLITIISHLREWQCNYKDKNGKIGIRKQMYWLHLLSSWCEIFMLKYDKPNEWRPTLRNERNMKELSWLLNFVLDCVNNKEYYILFVSPKVMIIDFILLYMICVHTNKYMHLFQTHLNHNGVQTLLSGIIKMDYLKNILRPYTYYGGMMQSQMPLMQIQNVQNIQKPSIFNPYF